ncbi:MAG: PAS domain-containing protein [Thiobacillaceae bacterium]
MTLDDKLNSVAANEADDAHIRLTFSPTHVCRLSPDTVSRFDPLPSTLWVSEEGYILDCCAHTQEVFGFWRDDLRGQHVSMLLPDLKHTTLLDDAGIHPKLRLHCRRGTAFRGVNRDGIGCAYALTVQLISTSVGRGLMLILRSKS